LLLYYPQIVFPFINDHVFNFFQGMGIEMVIINKIQVFFFSI
jgi:hypothetical protein